MKILLCAFNKQKGFTIIELLIAFSVITILSTVSIASYVNYSKNQAFSQNIADFVNVLNTAKSKAYSQAKTYSSVYGCASTEVLNGYRVTIVNSTTYKLGIVCSGTEKLTNAPTYTLKDMVINSTIASPNPSSTSSIFFNVLSGGVSEYGSIVFNYNNSIYKTVSVSSVGVISVSQ